MRKLHTVAYVLLTTLLLVGCDSNDESGLPSVAGQYSGELRITEADTPNISVNFLMQANVIQREEDLTITASLIMDGVSEAFPAVTGEISKTGFFIPTAGGTVQVHDDPDPECGDLESYSSSITFEDDVMTYTAQETSESCDYAAIARLTRQG